MREVREPYLYSCIYIDLPALSPPPWNAEDVVRLEHEFTSEVLITNIQVCNNACLYSFSIHKRCGDDSMLISCQWMHSMQYRKIFIFKHFLNSFINHPSTSK